jgi:hypothetical protein
MRALVLLAILSLGSFACDDPVVTGRVMTALAHGSVAADVACSGTVDSVACDVSPYALKATRFADGSTLLSFDLVNGYGAQVISTGTTFLKRGDPVEATVRHFGGGSATVLLEVGAGFATFTFDGSFCGSSPVDVSPTVDLEDPECSGFNLEEFGVN